MLRQLRFLFTPKLKFYNINVHILPSQSSVTSTLIIYYFDHLIWNDPVAGLHISHI